MSWSARESHIHGVRNQGSAVASATSGATSGPGLHGVPVTEARVAGAGARRGRAAARAGGIQQATAADRVPGRGFQRLWRGGVGVREREMEDDERNARRALPASAVPGRAADPENSYLQYSLQAAAHGDLVYVFRPSGGVLLCDLAQCPPKWRCIRHSASGQDWTQGCAMDLRLDTLL